MKKSGGLCTRGFSIPSVADIKQANKVSANRDPTLFTATHATAATRVKEKELSTARAVGNSRTYELEPHAAPVQGSSVSFPGPHVEEHVAKTRGHLLGDLEESSEATVSRKDSTGSELAATGVSDCPGNSGSGGGRATESVSESSSHAAAGTGMGPGVHHHPHTVITNPVQKNNPVMRHIRNVPWELGDIVPDFVLGRTTCALFLSVRYHSLHPDYIHTRLKELGKQYELRILLVHVDTSECHKILQELAKIAILADLTLVLAWSYEEAGRYLETYKAYENKPPDLLMERVDSDFTSRVTESLTTVKKVNKTDAATLLNNFKTMEKVIMASREELTLCPGLGPQKAQRLHDLFHEPFIRQKKPRLN